MSFDFHQYDGIPWAEIPKTRAEDLDERGMQGWRFAGGPSVVVSFAEGEEVGDVLEVNGKAPKIYKLVGHVWDWSKPWVFSADEGYP